MIRARALPNRQRGLVAVLVIALLVLGSLLFVFSSSGLTSVRVERERSTHDALATSKEGLIAYAVSHTDGVPVVGAPARPGTLPCPDADDDGHEDYDIATDACRSLTGRLPWITLGLPDLRDDSGERLWYSVSNDFRSDRRTVPGVPRHEGGKSVGCRQHQINDDGGIVGEELEEAQKG